MAFDASFNEASEALTTFIDNDQAILEHMLALAALARGTKVQDARILGSIPEIAERVTLARLIKEWAETTVEKWSNSKHSTFLFFGVMARVAVDQALWPAIAHHYLTKLNEREKSNG